MFFINIKNNGKNSEPLIKGRLKAHSKNWETLNPPKWLLTMIKNGLTIPFHSEPPCMVLPNNSSANSPDNVQWIRDTLNEYIKFGFIKKVSSPPKLILPLQISVHSSGKKCLIHDESPLNEYVEKSKFKIEGWEEMFNYSLNATCGIQFDLKKFYYEIDINENQEGFFGFMYPMEDGIQPEYFVWSVLPYGYTRAPFIAKSLLKPLLAKWRSLGIFIVVYVDDGFAVSSNPNFLKRASLQIQCDLLRMGLLPGVEKCFWNPSKIIQWNGLKWDFVKMGISILQHRIEKCLLQLQFLISTWPNVSFRDVSKFVGQISSMLPVFEKRGQLRTRFLQMVINTRHFFDCSWEKTIFSDNNKLFSKAEEELTFWITHLVHLNFRKFISPPPTTVGWVDASGFAAGGVICRIKERWVGKYRPTTADNLLLPVTGLTGLAALHDGAQWHVDGVRQSCRQAVVRDKYDLNPELVEKIQFTHRMFDYAEIATDSNEREMLAARDLILGSKEVIQNSVLTLHMDNMNAATIFSKGSPKPRLHRYATEIDKLSILWNFKFQPVSIPRSLNNFSDKISKCMDYEDYGVSEKFFFEVCQLTGVMCNFDRFANNWNTKTAMFNSASFCVGTSGVDAFSYSWGLDSINWLFPPPRLIVQAINHLQLSQGVGLLLTPEWKASHFYPYLIGKKMQQFIVNKLSFKGKNIFTAGSDKSSYFGPNFNCGVNVWHLDFSRK